METFKIGKLEVTTKNIIGPLYKVISHMEPGWRFPTAVEINYLSQLHQMGIGGFLNETYFFAGDNQKTYQFDEDKGPHNLVFNFDKMKFGTSGIDIPHCARFVREI